MRVSLIAALSENNVIGRNRGMPWHMPEDLKYFFRVTKNHHVIMGRRTFHEFGVSKPLPDRVNLIVSHEKNLKLKGTIVFNSIESAIGFAKANKEEELFIIGGGNIYKQTIKTANRLYLTRIHTLINDGDTFFPEINWNEWTCISTNNRNKDVNNPFDYSFMIYDRV